MLNGVIMDNAGKSFKQPASNLLSKVDMQQQNIKRIGKNRYKVMVAKVVL